MQSFMWMHRVIVFAIEEGLLKWISHQIVSKVQLHFIAEEALLTALSALVGRVPDNTKNLIEKFIFQKVLLYISLVP